MPRGWEKDRIGQWDESTGNTYSEQKNKEYLAKLLLVSAATLTVNKQLQIQQEQQNGPMNNAQFLNSNICNNTIGNYNLNNFNYQGSSDTNNFHQQNLGNFNGPYFQQNNNNNNFQNHWQNSQSGPVMNPIKYYNSCGDEIYIGTPNLNSGSNSDNFNSFNNSSNNFNNNRNNFNNNSTNNFSRNSSNSNGNWIQEPQRMPELAKMPTSKTKVNKTKKNNLQSAQIQKNPVLYKSAVQSQQTTKNVVKPKYTNQWRHSYKQYFIKKGLEVPTKTIIKPDALDFNNTIGEKTLRWGEYREKMKPIQNREFINARRSIMRLEKLPYESLNESQRFRLQNAREAVEWHNVHKTICNPSVRMPPREHVKEHADANSKNISE